MNNWFKKALYETALRLFSLGIFSVCALLIADFIISKPDMSGRWYLVFAHDQTTNSNLDGQISVYELMIVQADKNFSGHGEAIGSREKNGEIIEYDRKVKGNITGFVKDYFIKEDEIKFVYAKQAQNRQSHYFFNFMENSNSSFSGTYISTGSGAGGRAELVTNLEDSEIWSQK